MHHTLYILQIFFLFLISRFKVCDVHSVRDKWQLKRLPAVSVRNRVPIERPIKVFDVASTSMQLNERKRYRWNAFCQFQQINSDGSMIFFLSYSPLSSARTRTVNLTQKSWKFADVNVFRSFFFLSLSSLVRMLAVDWIYRHHFMCDILICELVSISVNNSIQCATARRIVLMCGRQYIHTLFDRNQFFLLLLLLHLLKQKLMGPCACVRTYKIYHLFAFNFSEFILACIVLVSFIHLDSWNIFTYALYQYVFFYCLVGWHVSVCMCDSGLLQTVFYSLHTEIK